VLLERPLIDRTSLIEQPTGHGRLAMIYVANDHEIQMFLFFRQGIDSPY
jgi:hypothetical protein